MSLTKSPLLPVLACFSFRVGGGDFALSFPSRYRTAPQTLSKSGRKVMSWNNQQSAFDPPQAIAGLVSPQQAQSPTLHTTPRSDSAPHRKRKRTLTASELDHHHHYPGDGEQSVGGGGLAGSPSQHNGNKARHQPGVKRACNDCRQQKVVTTLHTRVIRYAVLIGCLAEMQCRCRSRRTVQAMRPMCQAWPQLQY